MGKQYITAREMTAAYPFVKPTWLRYLLRENINDIKSTTIRIAGKILFDKEMFDKWLADQKWEDKKLDK